MTDVQLDKYLSFIKGKKPTASKESLMNYLSIDGILKNNFEKFSSNNMIIAEKDDILMVMDGASSGTVFLGYCGIVSSTMAKIFISEKKLKLLIFQMLKQEQTKIKELNTGSAIPHANKKFINTLTIKISPDIKQFNYKLGIIQNKIVKLRNQIIQLQELKQLYLKKFFG